MRLRLPRARWLDARRGPPTLRAAIEHGWHFLHNAALIGDRAGRFRFNLFAPFELEPPKIDWEHYEHRVGRIVAVLGVEPRKVGGEWHALGSVAISRLTARISPRNVNRRVGRSLLRQLVYEARDAAKMESRYAESHRTVDTFGSPRYVFRVGYGHAMRLDPTGEPSRRVAVGLALIGIAGLPCLEFKQCGLCFRLALPGYKYCAKHEQSILVGRTPSLRAHAARTGRKARAVLDQSGKSVKVSFDIVSGWSELAHILWPSAHENERAVMREVRETLNASPRVCRILGASASLRGNQLVEALRRRLDPIERRLEIWPEKIRRAEVWLGAEEQVSPGTRGISPKTTARIAEAEGLAKTGLGLQEIASRLGIGPSAISNWIARGRAPGLARLRRRS